MFYDLLIFIFMSYIKPQLVDPLQIQNLGCISYYSCIKPQLRMCYHVPTLRCISYYSYIKPQLPNIMMYQRVVVYRTIPTSNHNFTQIVWWANNVVYRTIPTSNHNSLGMLLPCYVLYIVLFLHQTTTLAPLDKVERKLYIVLFLHQTTTPDSDAKAWLSCISYYSYIKPQLMVYRPFLSCVVYRTIPTSNHN